jgi:hypothetical protein
MRTNPYSALTSKAFQATVKKAEREGLAMANFVVSNLITQNKYDEALGLMSAYKARGVLTESDIEEHMKTIVMEKKTHPEH